MRKLSLRTLAIIVIGILIAAGVYWYYSNYRFTREAHRILETTCTEGGLIIHLGFDDARLTTAMHTTNSYLIHGITPEKIKVEKARRFIKKKGLYGKVSVEQWDQAYLPYTANLVNLVVAENSSGINLDEIMRVLAPNGVAYIKGEEGWEKRVKPRPAAIDEWTHYLHGPDNNAVAQDSLVGPPRYLQWDSEPRWMRSHEHLASLSALVSSGERVFSIIDKGSISFITSPSKWVLEARDAFNGVLLWEREIKPWEYHLRGFRSGPPELQRKLVADNDRVYATLGYNKPVVALDAATGAIEKRYSGTDGTLEIVHKNGVLYLVSGERSSLEPEWYSPDRVTEFPGYKLGALRGTPRAHDKRLIAVKSGTGEILWQKEDASTNEILPVTLCLGGDRLFFENPGYVVCLDAHSGDLIWKARRPVQKVRLGWSTPTLVYYDGIVYSADGQAPEEEENGTNKVNWIPSSRGGVAPEGELIAFSAETGEQLWSCSAREGYSSPVDILITGEKLWTGNIVMARDPGITRGRNPKTGNVDVIRPRDQEFYSPGMGHHRCYRNKATSRYLITGRAGTEFIEIGSGKAIPDHWVRGTCQYGIMPCNGLLYVPPHPCACFIRAKINGFNALAHSTSHPSLSVEALSGLQKGPAYNKTDIPGEASETNGWTTYRHDSQRSGHTSTPVPENLSHCWTNKLKGNLTSPVVSGERLYVASIDEHLIHALDAGTGRTLWDFTAGGRIDSPPTIYKDCVFFGSADGYVYCLRASDGKLVWRFRAGPFDRRIVSYGQLESAWPVHGTVLVKDGNLYFVAGRSSFLDGGLYLYSLDPQTGEVLKRKLINSRDPITGQEPRDIIEGSRILDGALPDILSCKEGSIFLRHMRFNFSLDEQEFNVPHLFSPTGFLDDSWWHRNYWIMGTDVLSGWSGWPKTGNIMPSGRLLVFNDSIIYGFGRNSYGRHGSHVGIDPATCWGYNSQMHDTATYYRLFKYRQTAPSSDWTPEWEKRIPLLVRSMIMSDSKIFLAGPADTHDRLDLPAAMQGAGHGMLYILSSEGEMISRYKLDASPVFDGMAAAGRKLYISTLDGSVVCLGGQ